MFLQHKSTECLIEILNIHDLYNPFCENVLGQSHAGEEMQDPADFAKAELVFPSGESLPRCWLDPDYRAHQKMAIAIEA